MRTGSSQQRRKFKNDIFIEAVRCILGLPSHILQSLADEHNFIGRNATVVDVHGIMVKNATLINGDYHRMHASIQSLIIDMFKKAKIWAIREPQNIFHGLVPAEIIKEYCDQHNDLRPSTSRKVWTGDTTKTNFRDENDASR